MNSSGDEVAATDTLPRDSVDVNLVSTGTGIVGLSFGGTLALAPGTPSIPFALRPIPKWRALDDGRLLIDIGDHGVAMIAPDGGLVWQYSTLTFDLFASNDIVGVHTGFGMHSFSGLAGPFPDQTDYVLELQP